MSGISSIGYAPASGQYAVTQKNGQVKLDQKEMFAPEKQQEKKNTNYLKDAGIVACALVGFDLLFFKGKHIKGLLTKLGVGKKAVKTVKPTVLEKAKTKEWDVVSQNKKHRIKNISSTGARKPITNKREAEIVQNINTQHASAKNRKLVEQAQREVVTPEMQAKYDREIAHVEMTQEEKLANAANNAKNRKQAAELNNIANNSKGGEQLSELKKSMEAAEKAAEKTGKRVFADGEYMLDGNKYVIKNGDIQEMTLKGAQKPQTKRLNIEKHKAGSNVLERLKNGEGEMMNSVAQAA